jgi:hypothetical protein
VEEVALVLNVQHPTFEEWWQPFTLGVGPAGEYYRTAGARAATGARAASPRRAARAAHARDASVGGTRSRAPPAAVTTSSGRLRPRRARRRSPRRESRPAP